MKMLSQANLRLPELGTVSKKSPVGLSQGQPPVPWWPAQRYSPWQDLDCLRYLHHRQCKRSWADMGKLSYMALATGSRLPAWKATATRWSVGW